MLLLSRTLIVLLLLVGLVGCVPEFLGKYTLPRKEPVRDAGYQPTLGRLELIASTNCAEVGEVVTFTLRYINETAEPITIVSDPPMDIVIEALRVTTSAEFPTQRWSASDQYPVDINSIVQPGDERVYTWQWAADGVYAQEGLSGVMVKSETRLRIPGLKLPQGIGSQVYVGVERFAGGEVVDGISCTSLR